MPDVRDGVVAGRVVHRPLDRHRAELVRHRVLEAVQRERDAVPEEQVLLRFVLRSAGGGEEVRGLADDG